MDNEGLTQPEQTAEAFVSNLSKNLSTIVSSLSKNPDDHTFDNAVLPVETSHPEVHHWHVKEEAQASKPRANKELMSAHVETRAQLAANLPHTTQDECSSLASPQVDAGAPPNVLQDKLLPVPCKSAASENIGSRQSTPLISQSKEVEQVAEECELPSQHQPVLKNSALITLESGSDTPPILQTVVNTHPAEAVAPQSAGSVEALVSGPSQSTICAVPPEFIDSADSEITASRRETRSGRHDQMVHDNAGTPSLLEADVVTEAHGHLAGNSDIQHPDNLVPAMPPSNTASTIMRQRNRTEDVREPREDAQFPEGALSDLLDSLVQKSQRQGDAMRHQNQMNASDRSFHAMEQCVDQLYSSRTHQECDLEQARPQAAESQVFDCSAAADSFAGAAPQTSADQDVPQELTTLEVRPAGRQIQEKVLTQADDHHCGDSGSEAEKKVTGEHDRYDVSAQVELLQAAEASHGMSSEEVITRSDEMATEGHWLTADVAKDASKDMKATWQHLILKLWAGGPALTAQFPEVPQDSVPEGPVSRLTSNFYLDVMGRALYDLQKQSQELQKSDDPAILAISDNFDEIVRHRSSLNPSMYARSRLTKMSKLEKLTALSKKRFNEQQAMIQDLTAQCSALKDLHGEEIKRSTKMKAENNDLEAQLLEAKQKIQALERKLRECKVDYADSSRYKIVQGLERNTDRFVEVQDLQKKTSIFIPAESEHGSFDVRIESVIIKRESLERLQFENLQLSQKVMCLKTEYETGKAAMGDALGQEQRSQAQASNMQDIQYAVQVKLEEQRCRLEADALEKRKHLESVMKDLISQNETLRKSNELLSREIANLKSRAEIEEQRDHAEEMSTKDSPTKSTDQHNLVAMLQDQLKQKEELAASLSTRIAALEERLAQRLEDEEVQSEKQASPTTPSSSSPQGDSLSHRSQAEELILLQAKHEQLRQRYMELQNLTGPETTSREAAHQRIFLKNAMMKFIESDPIGSPEHEGLIPVIMRLLNLTAEEIRAVESKRPDNRRKGLAQRIQFWN